MPDIHSPPVHSTVSLPLGRVGLGRAVRAREDDNGQRMDTSRRRAEQLLTLSSAARRLADLIAVAGAPVRYEVLRHLVRVSEEPSLRNSCAALMIPSPTSPTTMLSLPKSPAASHPSAPIACAASSKTPDATSSASAFVPNSPITHHQPPLPIPTPQSPTSPPPPPRSVPDAAAAQH